MESSGIIFKTSSLGSFAQPTQPGKYEFEVLSNVTERNQYESESGRIAYIVNLKAIAPDKTAQLIETFRGKSEVAIEETQGLFLTASIWKNGDQTPALPMKGEIVTATVGFVPNRDGEEVLRVTNIMVKAATSAPKFSLEQLQVAASEVVHS